ncbi:MAG: type III-A CRISPR-associated protein Csm2 [Caldiserica bacterium]|jgi:CRISPR-associated protein Csm2|nr:type III-A CRISPR-associated protein Csm2 [Caldisericota bacterium]MDH7562832.1 type III-A CRISPR-associated protein Csm2 [Caldisericota bacterium]
MPNEERGQNFVPDEQKIERILGGDSALLNDYAEELGKIWAKLSTSKIRSILNYVQRIKPEEDLESGKLDLLRYKLAYLVGKEKTAPELFPLRQVLDAAIKRVGNKGKDAQQRFINFRNFVEAIVAYHRFHKKDK